MTGTRSGTTHALAASADCVETEHLMAVGHEDLDQLGADESGGSVTNAVVRASPAMRPVWSAGELATTDNDPHRTRTTPVQRR